MTVLRALLLRHRWGLFPSVALAWNISKENFLANNATVSNLKLRLGYGITGQQNLGDNDYPYQAVTNLLIWAVTISLETIIFRLPGQEDMMQT